MPASRKALPKDYDVTLCLFRHSNAESSWVITKSTVTLCLIVLTAVIVNLPPSQVKFGEQWVESESLR